MSNKQLIRNSTAEFLTFTAQSGENSIEARYEDETIWLTQKLMSELFERSRSTITEHLKRFMLMVNWIKKWYVGISDTPLNTVLLKEKSK